MRVAIGAHRHVNRVLMVVKFGNWRNCCNTSLVTIAVCNTLDEAQLLKARLAGSNVSAFIPDEFMAQTESPVLFTGGIRVQVPAEQAEEARLVVADPGNTP